MEKVGECSQRARILPLQNHVRFCEEAHSKGCYKVHMFVHDQKCVCADGSVSIAILWELRRKIEGNEEAEAP